MEISHNQISQSIHDIDVSNTFNTSLVYYRSLQILYLEEIGLL